MREKERSDLAAGRWDERRARQVIEAWRRSGESAYGFCRERGIDPQRLYWWRKRLDETVQPERAVTLARAVVAPAADGAPAAVVHVGEMVAIEIADATVVSPTWVAAMVNALLGKP